MFLEIFFSLIVKIIVAIDRLALSYNKYYSITVN